MISYELVVQRGYDVAPGKIGFDPRWGHRFRGSGGYIGEVVTQVSVGLVVELVLSLTFSTPGLVLPAMLMALIAGVGLHPLPPAVT